MRCYHSHAAFRAGSLKREGIVNLTDKKPVGFEALRQDMARNAGSEGNMALGVGNQILE